MPIWLSGLPNKFSKKSKRRGVFYAKFVLITNKREEK
jgi:hypothetical protein